MKRQIAIVTGTSRLKGIGRAICVELAKSGIDIFFTFWTKYDEQMPWNIEDNEPDLIQDEIRRYGVKCEKLELDFFEETSIEILFNEVEKKLGVPTILVNNATYSTQTNIEKITAEELDKHYIINFKVPTLLIAEFVRRFNVKKNGRIINLTSGQTLSFMNDEIAYATTKSAIETLTRTISQEIAKKGITINAVNPGLTDTGWLDDKQEKIFKERFPMGRLGQPSDVAKLISFLASENAEWVTGQIIHSEGGFIRENYSN
ncbi:SDR family oxidoreductase [Marivirga tractuosa]|uniref:SDR family oxidoreductase n=1 Tax=Marivirga tractuosa TaxID=1006 RepID=UPI0035CE9F40